VSEWRGKACFASCENYTLKSDLKKLFLLLF
jgi:hypothetical protein